MSALKNLPTVRELVAYLLIPWLSIIVVGAVGAFVFGVSWAMVYREELPPPLYVLGALVSGSFAAWVVAAIGWPVWRGALRPEDLLLDDARVELLEERAAGLEQEIETLRGEVARTMAQPPEDDTEPITFPVAHDGNCRELLDYVGNVYRCDLAAGHGGEHAAQSPTNPDVTFRWWS